jgi:phosphatidylglycerophosphate synthase
MDLSPLFSFNRKIALRLTDCLAGTCLRPNHVTTLALCSGLVAGYCMSLGTPLSIFWGTFFMHGFIILDNCDGELARRKNLQSRFGMGYDFAADLTVDFALWTGLGFGAWHRGFGPYSLWVSFLASAGSVVNFLRVIRERKGSSSWGEEHPSETQNPFSKLLHTLSRDGDPSLIMWGLAATGDPRVYLVLGCFYIHVLWVYGFFASVSARPTISSKS